MFKRAVCSIAMLAAAILIAGQALKSQAPATPQWEFASVTAGGEYGQQDTAAAPAKWYGGAGTCIATSQGCQGRTTTVEGSAQNAMMQAASVLGDQGWELVSVTMTHPANGATTMFFKRLKATPK